MEESIVCTSVKPSSIKDCSALQIFEEMIPSKWLDIKTIESGFMMVMLFDSRPLDAVLTVAEEWSQPSKQQADNVINDMKNSTFIYSSKVSE